MKKSSVAQKRCFFVVVCFDLVKGGEEEGGRERKAVCNYEYIYTHTKGDDGVFLVLFLNNSQISAFLIEITAI